MKNNKLRTIIAIILSLLITCGIIAAIVCVYYFYGDRDMHWVFQALWITTIVVIFCFDGIIALIIFNTKSLSDEVKAFWLFIALILPIMGSFLWIFVGAKKQKTYGTGNSAQTTLISHIFKASKSIKIYSNSAFFSYDTLKAINYACWKGVRVEILLTVKKEDWKHRLLKYDISKNLKQQIHVNFTNKEIEGSFVIVDDKEVLFNNINFDFKHMYDETVIYLTTSINSYLSLWNKDFIRSSEFKHNQDKPKWTTRLKYGIVNIFYVFF